METDPRKVSTISTTTPITAGVHAEGRSSLEPPEAAGASQLVKEIKGIGESLEGIPPPALIVGLAGTLPYLGTSLGSLYLSWNISKYNADFEGTFSENFVLLQPETAEYWLPVLQTVQVGYGACILSFLGAIHWGFEMSGFGGHLGLKRYILGASPALIAWPSILLPVDFALIAHFITFTGVWFADAACARKGLAPGWYNQYRFLLTFIVCTSILLTLIVSGWLGDPQQATPHSSRLESLREEEVKQFNKDNEAVAAKTRKGKSTKEDKIKRQGDGKAGILTHLIILTSTDMETLNDKEKETQAQDREIGKAKEAEGDSDAEQEDQVSEDKDKEDGQSNGAGGDQASPPSDGKDVKQNPDKKGGKSGGSKEPEGSAAKSDADGQDPVEAKKGSAATDNKTTSKEDSVETKSAEKSAAQKK